MASTNQETASSSQETASTNQETASTNQETASSSQETASTNQETASSSQKTASAKQPTTSPLEESKKTTPIQVIHIHVNGDPPSDPTLFAVGRDGEGVHNNLSQETKSRLKHIPDLSDYCDNYRFNWDHRGLYELVVPENRVPKGFKGWEGCYLMYKCGYSDSGLSFNRYFVGNFNAHVFGDAFLFKINGPECDQAGEATFEKLGPEFLKSLEDGTFAVEILSTFFGM